MTSNRPTSRPRLDWAGTILASLGLFAIVFGFSHAETAGWAAGLTIGSLVAGVVLLAAFVLAERRVSHPLLPLRVIMDRARGGSYISVGLTGIAVFGVFLFLIVLLPRVGPRNLIVTGMVLGGGAMAYLTQLTVTSSYATHVVPALVAMGLGFGMIFSPAINTATAGVSRQDSGVASALVNTMQQVGGSIGTAALSTVALTATSSYLVLHHTGTLAAATAAVHGYSVAFTVSAILFGVGVIVAILLIPSLKRLEELRNAALEPGAADQAGAAAADGAVPAGVPALADGAVQADGLAVEGVPAADPR